MLNSHDLQSAWESRAYVGQYYWHPLLSLSQSGIQLSHFCFLFYFYTKIGRVRHISTSCVTWRAYNYIPYETEQVGGNIIWPHREHSNRELELELDFAHHTQQLFVKTVGNPNPISTPPPPSWNSITLAKVKLILWHNECDKTPGP